MAVTQKNLGKCYICKNEFSKGTIKRHILKCNNLSNGNTKYFLIKVEDTYDKSYWLYLQVKATTTLNDLDDFLRNIWLECCGHLSSFTINGVIYDKYLDDFDDNEDMSEYTLNDILETGVNFKHEYDFGSTTTLKLTVTDSYTGIDSLEDISLLARNNKKQYNCENCDNKATHIIHDFDFENYKTLCDDCIEEIYDDEEYDMIFVTITNSPRMGICGYQGDNDVYELDED